MESFFLSLFFFVQTISRFFREFNAFFSFCLFFSYRQFHGFSVNGIIFFILSIFFVRTIPRFFLEYNPFFFLSFFVQTISRFFQACNHFFLTFFCEFNDFFSFFLFLYQLLHTFSCITFFHPLFVGLITRFLLEFNDFIFIACVRKII